jgi:ATP-dependent Clp protease ATP-binding subunit ClpA
MFERFTDSARRVIVLAQDEALALNHNYIGTEHLLLGVIGEPRGLGGRILESFGLSHASIRADVLAKIGSGDKPPDATRLPFTPRAKKVLELSLREALELHHDYIGTEHLVLGLLQEGSGVAAVILTERCGSREAVRRAVRAALPAARAAAETRPWASQPAAPVPGAGSEAQLLRTTPAADSGMTEAARLAGAAPVGSHHLVLAALANPDSAAARALAALGLDLDQAREALRQADVTGSGDELPQEAGRRQMLIRPAGDTLTVEFSDPDIVALGRDALEALGDQAGDPPAIRGTLPVTASLAAVWLALRMSLDDIRQRALAADENPPAAGAAKPGGEASAA